MSSFLTAQLRRQQGKDEAALSMPSPPNSSCGGDDGRDQENSAIRALSNERTDSLQTHFSALTLHQFSQSLPENYTIDHSSAIPIQPHHRPSQSTRTDSPLLSPSLTATAAGTGGRTVRHRRPSEQAASLGRRSRVLSESPGKHGFHQCSDCGKVYKHPNCLSKHRWEHSEQWELTSKLLLTKHQQVQMLEAAAILVSMDSSRRRSIPVPFGQKQNTHVPPRQEVKDEDVDEDTDEQDIDLEDEEPGRDTAVRKRGDDDDDDDDILIDLEEDEEDTAYVSSSSFTLNPRSMLSHCA